VINPATEEVLGLVARAEKVDVDRAVSEARAALVPCQTIIVDDVRLFFFFESGRKYGKRHHPSLVA
jgi:hypothetical protein